MKLQILPAQLANMIAAGEVVGRPSSVVKELMENAVDAGATDIKVIVTDAGRTLIQVIDNGCGMSPSDAVLCFERHATSKIASAEDLGAILSYGFRGEALASIAAVAEVTLKTRRKQDETATQVVIGDYGKTKTSTVTAPAGSNFAVRSLFYNTPARRKFLKSDNVELKHILEEFTRVALTHPEISFSLRSNDRDIYVLKSAKSLKFRILDLMGSNVTADVVDLDARTTTVGVSGFVGKPDSARKTVNNQYFFVNGRYFNSPYLRKAVLKAYEGFIPSELSPSFFIWLDVPPEAVDVNISPTKSEVKFEEDSVIYQILYACVKETLGRNSFGEGIDFDSATGVQMPQIGRSFADLHPDLQAPSPVLDPSYDPFDANLGFDSHTGEVPPPPGRQEPRQDYSGLFGTGGPAPEVPERVTAPERNLLIIKDKYIVSPVASGLMVVNIRRAMERIAYERSVRALAQNMHVTQKALFPVSVQVGAQARVLFEGHALDLAALGFDITGFGNDTVVVNGVPEGLSCEPGRVQQMIQDMVLILSDSPAVLSDAVFAPISAKFATLESLNFTISSTQEASSLLDSLFECENSELTPGGRRIIGIVSVEELNKKF